MKKIKMGKAGIFFLSVWISAACFGYSQTVSLADDKSSPEVSVKQSTAGEQPSFFEQSLSEIVREAAIENPFLTAKKTAEEAARSVGRSLGLYIRGQYQHYKNEDILQRFDAALAENLPALQLNLDERRQIVRKIQENYIQDAESGKGVLDQQNFRDLPKIVKKEYAEIELARTENGNIPTYDVKGMLKTLWTVEGGVLHGPAVTYYPSGEIQFIDIYRHGRKVNRKKFDEEGQIIFDQNYDYELPPAVVPEAGEEASVKA